MLHKVEEMQEDLEFKGQINSNSSSDGTGKWVNTLKLMMMMMKNERKMK
jgi:hypothetical protein